MTNATDNWRPTIYSRSDVPTEEAVLLYVLGEARGPISVLDLALVLGEREGDAVERAVVNLVGRGLLEMAGGRVTAPPETF